MKAFRGLLLCVLIVLVVWMASFFGVFSVPNGLLYDFGVKLSQFRSERVEVLVVQGRDADALAGDGHWLRILTELERLGPRCVGFMFMPPGASRAFYERAASLGNVVFGRAIASATEQSPPALASLPEAARGLELTWGVVAAPEPVWGVYRSQRTMVDVAGKAYPSFVYAAYRTAGHTDVKAPGNYLVNFMGIPGGVPKVPLERLFRGRLVRELVEGKCVLVGLAPPPATPGLVTPVSSRGGSMSLLEYTGYALDTLDARRVVTVPSPMIALGCLAMLAVVALFLFQAGTPRQAFGYALVLSLVLSASGLALLLFSRFLLPVLELLTVLWLVFFVVTQVRLRLRETTARASLLDISFELRERIQPSPFFDSKEYWNHIIVMVNQVLNLNRAIFLEPVENDHRVREVVALGTSIDDIVERRRDYQRTPYTTALEAGGPVEVSGYLGEVQEEAQFITPLVFAGEVEGFWAFSLPREAARMFEKAKPLVRTFAEEIAMLLHNRRKWREERELRGASMGRLMRMEAGFDPVNEVRTSIAQLSRRLRSVENVFGAMSTSILLYDLFGNLLHANKAMTDFLGKRDILPYDLTALDLAVALTGMEPEAMRRKLGFVIMHREPLVLPVTMAGSASGNGNGGGRSLILNVRPVISREQNQDEALPFQLAGLLFELVDLTRVTDMFQFKEQLFEVTNFHLKNDLDILKRGCGLLKSGTLDKSRSIAKMDELGRLLESLMDFVEQFSGYMEYDVTGQNIQVLPVSARTCLNAALSDVEAEGVDVTHGCDILECSMESLAYANPLELKALLAAILRSLFKDATEDGGVRAMISEDEEHVIYVLENQGYGLPQEALDRFLRTDDPGAGEQFGAIRGMMFLIGKWGGTFSATSEVGQGIRFELGLRKFRRPGV